MCRQRSVRSPTDWAAIKLSGTSPVYVSFQAATWMAAMVSASATVAMRITGATAHPVRRWSLSFPAHLSASAARSPTAITTCRGTRRPSSPLFSVDGNDDRGAGSGLTLDEAQWLAVNIAQSPELMRRAAAGGSP
jgi:hypothetical protein